MKCSVSLGRKALTMHLAGIFSRVSPRVTGRTSSRHYQPPSGWGRGTRRVGSREYSEARGRWRCRCESRTGRPLKRGAFRKTSSRSSQGISIGSVGFVGGYMTRIDGDLPGWVLVAQLL
jgi:hypothetical protein